MEMRERFCPHCGRANPVNMPRCINCGQRVGGNVLLAQEEPTTAHAPWWQTSEGSIVPPPPQVREQIAKQDAEQQAKMQAAVQQQEFQARLTEERLRSAERLTAIREHRTTIGAERRQNSTEPITAQKIETNAVTNCRKCGTALGQAGHTFSFCLNCGADTRPEPLASPLVSSQAVKNNTSAASGATVFAPAGTGASSKRTVSTRQVTPTVQITTITEVSGARTSASPGIAAFLSFVMPGIGQFLNGQPYKGVLLLLLLFAMTVVFKVGGLILLAARIIAALDAYRIAERRQAGEVNEDNWNLGG